MDYKSVTIDRISSGWMITITQQDGDVIKLFANDTHELAHLIEDLGI